MDYVLGVSIDWLDMLSVVISGLAIIATLVGGFLASHTRFKVKESYESQVEAIASAVTAVSPMSDERREEEWELVRPLVNEYHAQALSQAKVQFWFSVVAASFGFAIILVAIATALLNQTSQSLLQAVPGIAIEAVAALFFKQAAQTRERATDLYDRLRTDRERAHAVAIVETIDDSIIRNAIKAELALHIAGEATYRSHQRHSAGTLEDP